MFKEKDAGAERLEPKSKVTFYGIEHGKYNLQNLGHIEAALTEHFEDFSQGGIVLLEETSLSLKDLDFQRRKIRELGPQRAVVDAQLFREFYRQGNFGEYRTSDAVIEFRMGEISRTNVDGILERGLIDENRLREYFLMGVLEKVQQKYHFAIDFEYHKPVLRERLMDGYENINLYIEASFAYMKSGDFDESVRNSAMYLKILRSLNALRDADLTEDLKQIVRKANKGGGTSVFMLFGAQHIKIAESLRRKVPNTNLKVDAKVSDEESLDLNRIFGPVTFDLAAQDASTGFIVSHLISKFGDNMEKFTKNYETINRAVKSFVRSKATSELRGMGTGKTLVHEFLAGFEMPQ